VLRVSGPVITEGPGPRRSLDLPLPHVGDGTWQVDELIGKFVVVFAAQTTALSDPAGAQCLRWKIRKEDPK
jgi:hypothetical protein